MSVVNPNAQFFLVYNATRLGVPTKRHYTYEAAETEAKRLAGLERTSQFLVLQAVASVKTESVTVTPLVPPQPAPWVQFYPESGGITQQLYDNQTITLKR